MHHAVYITETGDRADVRTYIAGNLRYPCVADRPGTGEEGKISRSP